MLLHSLLRQLDAQLAVSHLPNLNIACVQDDSRRVRPGDLFIARPGTKSDGRQFIADAAARGAVAVVTATPVADSPLPAVVLTDIATATSRLAHILRGQPSHRLTVLGVTGTNGKTTTAYLLRHILASVGRRCGMIGTVEIDDGRGCRPAELTTPGAVDVADLMAAMRDNGCDSCAMEVSSHALDQGRVAGVCFAGAAFTNLTQDHLDYHKTMDAYAAAKARLFEMLQPSAVAAVNAEDPWSGRIARDCRGRLVRWGFGPDADYRATDVQVSAEGSRFLLTTPSGQAQVRMHLVGRHNVANALTAAALASEVCGVPAGQVAAALADAAGAPGRLTPVRCGQPFAVLVDYAHTDDALRNVLTALRPLTAGRLRVLFGCGGDRDRTKRPKMAAVAQELADVVYVTSDNPRTENPQDIINDITAGFRADSSGQPSRRIVVEIDRRRAIERALAEACGGDVVLLAGKGHEAYQIIGSTKHPFDDAREAKRVLQVKKPDAREFAQ